MDRTTVMIVEDQPIISQGLAIALAETDDLAVVASAKSVSLAREYVAYLQPDVVVVDVVDAVDAVDTEDVESLAPTVVVLTADRVEPELHSPGSHTTFVHRERSLSDLIETIRRGVATFGKQHESPVTLVPPLPIARNGLQELTARELEILELLMRRMSHRAIADTLHLSVNTVRTHSHNIQLKLRVHSNAEAVSYALGHGSN